MSSAPASLDKQFATLQARAALAGVTLYRTDDDRGNEVFVVSRWALTRELRTLDEVEKWLDLVTGEKRSPEVQA